MLRVSVNSSSGNVLATEFTLKRTKLKDRIKSAYCYENDIPLLRISYFKREFVEEMIENKLKEIGVERVGVNA